ncbi:MAG TPA: hypothetical protein DCR93_23640 [Cytophagales bacterium]|nr:hypothetical protein [Cytophagales bacterium]HAP62360.1 hypothetical protein [Cytophagales bacterium]
MEECRLDEINVMKMEVDGLHFSDMDQFFTVYKRKLSIPVNIRFDHIAASKPLSLRGLQPIFNC